MDEDCKTGKVVKSDLRRSDRVQINRVEHTSCPSQIELCLELLLRRIQVFCSFLQDFCLFLDDQNKGNDFRLFASPFSRVPEHFWSKCKCKWRAHLLFCWCLYHYHSITITTIIITTTNLIIMSLTDRFVLCRCPQLLSWWETTD